MSEAVDFRATRNYIAASGGVASKSELSMRLRIAKRLRKRTSVRGFISE